MYVEKVYLQLLFEGCGDLGRLDGERKQHCNNTEKGHLILQHKQQMQKYNNQIHPT